MAPNRSNSSNCNFQESRDVQMAAVDSAGNHFKHQDAISKENWDEWQYLRTCSAASLQNIKHHSADSGYNHHDLLIILSFCVGDDNIDNNNNDTTVCTASHETQRPQTHIALRASVRVYARARAYVCLCMCALGCDVVKESKRHGIHTKSPSQPANLAHTHTPFLCVLFEPGVRPDPEYSSSEHVTHLTPSPRTCRRNWRLVRQ